MYPLWTPYGLSKDPLRTPMDPYGPPMYLLWTP